MLYRIVKAIKYSRSLMGVHLSGNEGISKEFVDATERKLSATKESKREVNFRDI
jgi:hypothetical protein